MTRESWSEVDRYITERFDAADPALEAALEASATAGLPAIQVSPPQGKLLMMLAQAIRARRILEIGTLGGYSAIWLARALPADGRLVTLESEPRHAEVARANLARAGLAERVEVRLGAAAETLPRLAAEGAAPFDLVFIDADKEGYPGYLDWAVRLSRRGSLIVADNVVRDGAVADPRSDDPSVRAVRRMNDWIAGDPRVTGTAIQTVGVKGWDGLAFVLVTADPSDPPASAAG